MRPRYTLLALSLAGLACDKAGKPAAADSTPVQTASAASEVMSPDQSYKLVFPARWAGVFRTDTLSTAERGTARPGALNVVYLPKDTAVIPQTLVVVAVYDSAAWVKVRAEGGPPPGDSVMSKNGRVYMVALPQSNPFTPGSVDALKFDSLALKPADKSSMIRVP
ncbi:MAG: hypothetical protein ABJB74_11500 [Gemmatimonas sp.]